MALVRPRQGNLTHWMVTMSLVFHRLLSWLAVAVQPRWLRTTAGLLASATAASVLLHVHRRESCDSSSPGSERGTQIDALICSRLQRLARLDQV